MPKSKASSRSKSKVNIAAPVPEIPPEPEEPPDIKHIRVTVQGYKNIAPLFLVSELEVKVTYLGKDLGVSTKTQIIDDDYITAQQEGHEFVVECDINSPVDLDLLISNPVLLVVTEIPGSISEDLLLQLQAQVKPTPEVINLSADSEADLADAFLSKPVDRDAFISSPTSTSVGKKASKGSKASKSKSDTKSKSDVKSKSKTDAKKKKSAGKLTPQEKPTEEEIKIPTVPTTMGTAILDLSPLFLGENGIVESLPIIQAEKFYDDRIIPNKIMPRVVVEVTVDEIEFLPQDPNANVVNITVESIYNVPQLMQSEMKYSISTMLPTPFAKWKPMVLKGGKFTEVAESDNMKKWPDMLSEFGITTKYRLDHCIETIKNKTEENLSVITNYSPRIEWNLLKRLYLKGDSMKEFLKKLKKYRCLPLELYVTKDCPEVTSPESKPAKAAKKSKSKTSQATEKKPENYFHLMTSIDASTLLYPGVKKCRMVCPFNTFQEKEILELAGLENSYFVPRAPYVPPVASPAKKGSANKTPKEKGSKSSKGSSKGKGKGKGGGKDEANKNNLNNLLPPPPSPPLEPSLPVYSDLGSRMFVVIEVELNLPLQPKRPIEDLSNDLTTLLPKKPPMSKVGVSSSLANLYFKDVIKQLTDDLVHQHEHFVKEKQQCKCDSLGRNSQDAFIIYLQRSGVYQTYLMSITKAASIIVNDQFSYSGESNRNSKEYQNFIAEIYCSLIKEMNVIMNELTNSGAESAPSSPLMNLDSMLLYAREASEIGALLLADRYHLERISVKEKNENCWFDYAIFHLEIGNPVKALECLKESLSINCKHQYSLLLCGILLTEKKSFDEAETCFLSAIFQNQCCVEGWGVMHLFYTEIGNLEGADLCLEMANKYLNYQNEDVNYFNTVDDLAWTTEICPNTIFFKTAMLLIKMRALNFADKALSHEMQKDLGISSYYLAVILYYRQNYQKALDLLKEAEELHGSDYGVGSLMGHCYLQMGDLENARIQYMRIIESYNRPDDMHMLYVYLALLSEKLNDKQFARKILLLTCKYSPTPYTWLSTGLLYYSQRDLSSAEQCLTQANICDNRLPEIWGYLTLINLELHRHCEAELCYRQAKKHDMKNKELEKRIEELFKSNRK